MRARVSTGDAIAVASFVGTVAATAAVYARLPARVTTHFDIHGRADGWMNRSTGAWIVPALALGAWLVVRFGARLVPRDRAEWRDRLARSPLAAVGAIVMVTLSASQLLILRASLPGGDAVDHGRLLLLVLGGMWIALGVVFPRVRRNPFIGVRTVWTLVSDENWARTHRVASWACLAGGLVALACAAAGGPAAYAFGFAAFVASALVPVVYSWVLARRA